MEVNLHLEDVLKPGSQGKSPAEDEVAQRVNDCGSLKGQTARGSHHG